MKNGFLSSFLGRKSACLTILKPAGVYAFPWDPVLDAEYEPLRSSLSSAGLNEKELRQMDPDDRVAALEQAQLDPYDYIFLAC